MPTPRRNSFSSLIEAGLVSRRGLCAFLPSRVSTLSAHRTQRSAGWYAGALVFWLLAAWLAVVGLGSLVPQIFGPAFGAAKAGESCTEDLNDLTTELLDYAGDWLKAHRRQGARDTLERFFSDFDRRLMQTKASCTERERAAFTELARLRHGVEALLQRFEREELPHVRKLDALFDQEKAPTR